MFAVTAMGILAYREAGCVTVEIPQIIDHANEDAAMAALRRHLDMCEEPAMVVRLDDPVVTTSALRVLHDAHAHGRERGVSVCAVVDPLAEKVFAIAGMTHLLARGPGGDG